MATATDVTELDTFGKVVEDIDVDGPFRPDRAAELNRRYLATRVLVARGAPTKPEAFLTFARIFGEPQIQVLRDHRHPTVPEISYVSSEQRDHLGDGKKITFGSHWHTDDSYLAQPASATLLFANEIPASGGDTLFADMYAAYDTLPDAMKARIAPLKVVHKYRSRRNVSPVPVRRAEEKADTPDVVHPLVRTHPETGRKALYLNPNRMDHIVGMSLADSDTLLDELIAHATQERFVYRHRWQAGDIAIWDNRCTMHKASPDYGDAKREMLRILLKGDAPR